MADAKKLHLGGADIEMLLMFMRVRGFYQIDSILALRQILGMSMSEAKNTIDQSKTWSDQFSRVQRLRDVSWKALVELSRQRAVDLPEISMETEDPE